MPRPVFLSGDRLDLCAVTPDDYEFVARHWNDPSIRRMTSRQQPQTRADVADLLEATDAGEEPGEVVPFLACAAGAERREGAANERTESEASREHDGEPVGFAWAFRLDDVNGHGELGYWIVESERGQGYGTETVDLVAEWAFRDRQLHRLQARVFEGNEGSERVLETVGFEREGRLRDAFRVEGEYVDATVFGLLADEWRD